MALENDDLRSVGQDLARYCQGMFVACHDINVRTGPTEIASSGFNLM
jgi:hypothetical protein